MIPEYQNRRSESHYFRSLSMRGLTKYLPVDRNPMYAQVTRRVVSSKYAGKLIPLCIVRTGSIMNVMTLIILLGI